MTLSGIAFVMMARSMQAKSEGRGAAMGLGFGEAGWSMKRVYMVRGIGAILPTSVGREPLSCPIDHAL
jgi:hypothetical protein